MLKEKILNRESGIITYGMTPPKQSHSAEKMAEIAQKQLNRLRGLEIDGLILYDVQDEADRVDEDRPFPYLQTADPMAYSKQYLQELDVAKIIYRCAAKDTEQELAEWVGMDPRSCRYSVFVGASSSKQKVNLTLSQAYQLSSRQNSNLLLGGVVIPERHMKKQDEHLRITDKVNNGCKFFVSQAAYHVEASKNMLSDYYYYCQEQQIDTVPILINLAPCGSKKTLEFMKWLGISIPKWLENDLMHSNDILDKSISLCKDIFSELYTFGREKGIPIGCSVESVSTRKVEIEASIQLVKDIQAMIKQQHQTHEV